MFVLHGYIVVVCVSSIVAASITPDDLSDFTALYREHCKVMSCTQVSIAQRSAIWVLGILQAILDVVQNLQFQMVENLWFHFWV